MRYLVASTLALIFAFIGCPASGTPTNPGQPPTGSSPTDAPSDPTEIGSTRSSFRSTPPDQIPADRRVHAYVDGQHRVMAIDEARSVGLTVVDLSDDWVPYIFWSQTPGKKDYKNNEHLDTYVDLANDRIDVDGVALRSWERNYLEVYGIPPSLGVLRRRFIEDEEKECYKKLGDTSFLIDEYHGPIRVGDPKGSERELRKYYGARAAYRKALRSARVRTLEALLRKPRYRKVAEKYQRYHWRHRALQVMQQRLACEKMYGRRTPRLKPGIVNWAVRQALRQFERKHNIYGWGLVFQNTAQALGRSPLENNYRTLKRVLTERAVSAARILEDGTIRRATYKSTSGKRLKVRNLVKEFSEAIIQQMGLTEAGKALAFMKQHSEQDFSRFLVAVRLPHVPEYYSDHMDLSVVIDRGDVWYDVPFDEKGKPKNQPRARFPYLTLYVDYNDQKIPLVRWRTTIGGWQPEIRHDEEYYKYKISDVGKRIWRHIVAGPVWVPPPNTPSRDMVKIRPVRNRVERIVAHQSFGPGYASAYGLVAAYHVTKGGKDNQVRTHGTVNYMSIKSSKGFSHGCHRLFNYRAVRLFSFVLAHRNFERIGQKRLRVGRKFEHRGEEFQMDILTRGYFYEMKPPVQVEVLEGRIRGKTKDPVEEYVKKPTVVYQDDLKLAKTKKPSSAPRVKTKQTSTMHQPQDL